jgi:hypothetical protein
MVSNVVVDLVYDVVEHLRVVVVESAVLVGSHGVRIGLDDMSNHWSLSHGSRSHGGLLLSSGLFGVELSDWCVLGRSMVVLRLSLLG